MSRLDMITIGIVVVCLAALGYLVYKIVNLMNPPTETTSIADSYADQSATDDSTYEADSWDDEVTGEEADADLDDDDLAYDTTDDEGASKEAGGMEDNEGIDESAGSKTEGSSFGASSTDRTSSGSIASTSSGRYLVIAGSFQQRANADRQASKLRRLGYSATEVSIFDRGKHAVVLVDRFSRLSEANQLVRKLAGDGVESFVKERN